MSSDSEVKVIIGAEVSGLQDGASAAVDSSKTIQDTLDELKAKAESGASGLDEAGKAAGAFGSALSSMGEIAAGVFGGIELEGIADKFKSFFEEATFGSFEFSENLKNLSISAGLSTDQLQVLQYAGTVTGTGMGRLQQEVNSVARAMTEFADGSKRATEAATTLGLDPSKWTSAYDALTQIGEKYKELTASGQQLSLANEEAFQVFLGGRFGMQSLAALERLPELEEEARASGVIMGKDMIEASDQAAESINRLSASWGAFEHQLGGILAPLAQGAIEGLRQIADLGEVANLGNEAGGANPLTGFSSTGPRSGGAGGDEVLQAAQQSQAQLKALFNENVADYEASQKEIMAAAGDTAEARMAYEKNVVAFLQSQETAAAAAGVDLSSKISEASVAEASAQTAAAKESAAAWKASGLEVQTYIREQAKMQMDALDTMYADFKTLGGETLDHIKEKWGELDAAEQQAVQDLKANSEVIASAVTPITSAFETAFTGVIQGTQTLSQAWAKMLDSMGLELLKSGLHDLLLGGSKNTIGAEVFGTTGEGGGIAGQIAQAFSGSAVAAGLKTSFTTAWDALTGPITNVFGNAFNAIGGIIKNLFGSALSGAGSAVASGGAGAALGAAGGATQLAVLTSIEATLTTELSLILGTLVAANVALDAMNAELITLDTIEAAKIVQPFGFSGGGIVPSAAGGMIVGGGSGGSLAIVHPREMVLPANLSEGIQNLIGGGSGGGGGDNITVNLSISAIDGPSVENLFNQGRVKDLIGNAVLSKIRDGRAVGQLVHRGMFRR